MIIGHDVLREARARFHPASYLSDWTSGLALGAGILAPAAHIFFLSLFPALAFSAQMEAGTGGAVAGVQVLMSTAIFGLVQAVLGAVSLESEFFLSFFPFSSLHSIRSWKRKTPTARIKGRERERESKTAAGASTGQEEASLARRPRLLLLLPAGKDAAEAASQGSPPTSGPGQIKLNLDLHENQNK